jgi:hypothetical protein
LPAFVKRSLTQPVTPTVLSIWIELGMAMATGVQTVLVAPVGRPLPFLAEQTKAPQFTAASVIQIPLPPPADALESCLRQVLRAVAGIGGESEARTEAGTRDWRSP